MKDIYVADLAVDQEFDGFFIVKEIDIKVGSNGKQYLKVVAADSTGDINCNKWGIVEDELPGLERIKVGSYIKIIGTVKEFRGAKQIDIRKIRLGQKEDKLDVSDFIKSAPEDSEEMWSYIHDIANGIKDEDLRYISLTLLKEYKDKLMYYPAAQKNHHAEYGGLLYHTKCMLMNGINMCSVYTNLRPDWVKAGVIIHDIEKINEIESNEIGISPGYSFEGQLLGHIVQSIKTIEKMADEIGMDDEKKVMLQHMMLSHHLEPEWGSPKRPMFPEAELLHYLDIIDARLYDMENALVGVEPGGFSEKVWVLDNRRIYKPTF